MPETIIDPDLPIIDPHHHLWDWRMRLPHLPPQTHPFEAILRQSPRYLLDELLAFVSDGLHSVLLSSHITSDLDRAADRVICIDNGSIIFDLPREDITDRAGIAHCTQAQAAELMACVEGARAVHHAYSVDVLVPNRRETLEAFPEIPCDRATIDDYLRLMLKGASK